MLQEQNGNSSTVTTTDPHEATRTPQVQSLQCGGTQIHTCITGGSASSGVPMYVDMSRPVQTLSDLEARNQALNRQQQTVYHDQQPSASSCNQPSASSFHQPISLTEALEADAVRSNSSRLSHSSPPNQPPPTHPGPLPHSTSTAIAQCEHTAP